MSKKTEQAIAAEIAALKNMLPHVRSMTVFGENNIEAIEAQIQVLAQRMNEDAVYYRYQPVDDDGQPDDTGANSHTLDSALDACQWISGEKTQAPSEDWRPLDRRHAHAKSVKGKLK